MKSDHDHDRWKVSGYQPRIDASDQPQFCGGVPHLGFFTNRDLIKSTAREEIPSNVSCE